MRRSSRRAGEASSEAGSAQLAAVGLDHRHPVRLMRGEELRTVMELLGHSTIRLTINTYSHLSPRYQRESFGRFGDALGGR